MRTRTFVRNTVMQLTVEQRQRVIDDLEYGADKRRNITLYLKTAEIDRLDDLAREIGCTRADVIRAILKKGLDRIREQIEAN